jgi:4-amino-4-deoxy-L-arabinose transferase-like glycosyltransferase
VNPLASELAARRNLALACIWLIALLLYLPGFTTLPATDRDEARFAQASRQMRESGDLVDIRFQNEPRYKKPIAIYWLQAAAASLVGGPANSIWPYRLPSLISALIALGFVLRLGERLFDRRVGLIAALLLSASLLLGVEARLAKTDAALLATSLASFDALAAAYLGGTKRWSWIQFWAALGLGVLIKGPILPMLLISTLATLAIADRRIRWLGELRPALGIPLLLLLVAPWLVAIAVASHGAFFAESLGHDFAAKLLGGEESHGAPPGYYLVALSLTFWPGALLAIAAAPATWRQRSRPAFRLLLAWLVPAWILLELTPTKLPHYVLPLYPAVALLTAAIFADRARPLGAGWPSLLIVSGSVLWFAVGLGLPAGLIFLEWYLGGGFEVWGLVTMVLVGAAMYATLKLLERDDRELGLATLLAASLALQLGGFGLMLPRFDSIWLSREAARLVAESSPCASPLVATVGYEEPSLVFLLGTDTRLGNAEDAAHLLRASRGNGCALALIDSEADSAFRGALGGDRPRLLGQISGLDYSKGRKLRLILYALY